MQNEFVGKLIFTTYMDCPNGGSGDPDCLCIITILMQENRYMNIPAARYID